MPNFIPSFELARWLTVYELGFVIISLAALSFFWEMYCRMMAQASQERAARDTERSGKRNPYIRHPFMSTTPENHFRLRYIWPGPLLVPFRLFGLFMVCVVVSISGFIICATAPRTSRDKPLSGWRRIFMVTVSQILSRLLLLFAGFHHIKVIGRCASPQEAPMIVSNHRGPFEAFFLFSQHYCCMVSRVENRIWPLFYAMDALQFICVDRFGTSRERKGVIETIRTRATSEEGWPQTAMFPEGVCTNGQGLIQFKNGAFTPGVAVQPVVFEYPGADTDPSWVHGLGGPASGLINMLLRLTATWSTPMTVRYLPVHVPTAQEKGNPSLFAENVRRRMAEALRVPMTEDAMEDTPVATAAAANCVDPKEAVPGVARILQTFGMRLKSLRKALEKFRDVNGKGKGKVRIAELATAFDIDSDLLGDAFSQLSSEDAADAISFRAFLDVFSVLTRDSMHLSPAERAARDFDVLDEEGDGVLSVESLATALRRVFAEVPSSQAAGLLAKLVGDAGNSSGSGSSSDTASDGGKPDQLVKAQFIACLTASRNASLLCMFDLIQQELGAPPSGEVPDASSCAQRSLRQAALLVHHPALLADPSD